MTVETITPLENRGFTSSLGDWTGDATWEAGPISGYSDLMDFLIEPGGADKQAELAYPHIKLPKDTECVLDILSGKELTVAGTPLLTITLQDTAGNIITLAPPVEPLDVFGHNYYVFTTPATWEKTTGGIIITASFPDAAEGHVYVDFISITYELEKVDHLALMGVH